MITSRLTSVILALAIGTLPIVASAQNSNISLNVSGATLAEVLSLLSAESGRNIVADNSVPNAPITLRLTNVTLDDALQTIMSAYHLGKNVQPNGTIILGASYSMNLGSSVERVTYPLKYAQAQAVAQLLRLSLPIGTVILSSIPTNSVVIGGDADTQRTAASVVSALDKPSTQSLSQEFVLQYQDPTTTLAALKLGIDTTQFTYTAVANQTNNAVVVTGPPASVDAVKSFLASFDRPGKQVSFKIRVVDLEPTDSSNIGLIFGSTDSTGAVTQGSSFTDFLTRSYPLNATLNAMITKGSAQVLAEPTIKTLNNTPGKFLVGTVYPAVYNTSNGLVNTSTVQDVNVGVVVDLTPTVGADGSVKVLLHAEVSQINGFNATYPIIGTREIDDTLVLSDNQTLVIGGLREDSDTSTVMKVPGLGDIPLIGGLFKNKQTSNTHSEIAFFITPTIENSAPGQPADLVNPVHPEPPASANPPVLNSPLKDLKPGS